MAVNKVIGRWAITRFKEKQVFGDKDEPSAALIECWLETGRTHQIRVHMNYLGFSLVGDPVYASNKIVRRNLPKEISNTFINFNRPALHAKELGFVHPKTGELLNFKIDPPEDMKKLISKLKSYC
jgi:23S rRNA pseudouridine1911/1915/1917 synthase